MLFTLLTTPLITAQEFPPSSDSIYCFKVSNGIAKGLIYAVSSCYEMELYNTNQFTFYWNNPARKNIVPNHVTDFGIGCADLQDYMNGGSCYYDADSNVNCGIMYGRLEYLNRVLPYNNVTKSVFDYREADRRAKRIDPALKVPCVTISDGIECKNEDKGVIQWVLNGTDSAVIKVMANKTWDNRPADYYVSQRDYIKKFQALHTFFFYLKDAAFRTASEMIIYGSNITPMEYLCKACNSTVCGTGVQTHGA